MNPKTKYDPIAIDVSKKSLQIQTKEKSFKVSNDPKGYASLFRSLKGIKTPLIVLEATGGYEKALMFAAHEKSIPFCLVNPRRVRAFAISEGIKAKTDPIDAKVLMRFAEEKKLKPTNPPNKEQRDLADLLDRRNQLNNFLVKEKNRLDKSPKSILPFIKKMIEMIEGQINEIELAIRRLVKKSKSLSAMSNAMLEINGVGQVTAWTVLSYLPEITGMNRNQLVAMAGVAPYNRDSGKTDQRRCIFGGRSKVRICLYMAAQVAAKFNPVIKTYVEGLRQRGKPYKCAIVAGMRKLLLHIRSVLKKLKKSLA